MKIVQILAIAIIGVSFAMVIRPFRPEMALLTAVVTGVLILLYLMADLSGVITELTGLAERYGLNMDILAVLIKIIGIAYLAEIGARICTDAGESAIAAKVELCGRILILGAAMPQLISVLAAATKLLGSLTS